MFNLLIALLLSTTSGLGAPSVTPEPIPKTWNAAGKGKAYLLYRRYALVTGKTLVPYRQGESPSCVGCAAAMALQIMHPGVKFSPEWMFAQSKAVFDDLDRGGSYVSWAAHAAKVVGCLPSADYPILGVDYTLYDNNRANNHAIRGPPKHLEIISALYKSAGYHEIQSYEQLRGAISKGYPAIVGSSIGFGPSRGQVKGRGGTLRSRWWSKWRHAMVFIGVDDRNQKGALLMNSWGTTWVTGKKRFKDEPDGCFWISKRDVQKMLRKGEMFVILPIESLQ